MLNCKECWHNAEVDRENCKECLDNATEEIKKTFLTRENVDWDFCNWCQYRFKWLEEQEKYCKECLFYLLQED